MQTGWPHWRNCFCGTEIYLKCQPSFNQNINTTLDSEQTMIWKDQLINYYKDVFELNISKPVHNYEVQINLMESATSIFRKPYTIPCSIQNKVQQGYFIIKLLSEY